MVNHHFCFGPRRLPGGRGLAFGFMAAIAMWMLAAGSLAFAAEGLVSGIGTSLLEDPAAAGEEAARLAKEAFGPGQAKVALVYAAIPQLTPELIEGVARHFPAEIIHGAQTAAPLTPETNCADAPDLDADIGVGVLALGGDLDISFFSESTALPEGAELPAADTLERPEFAVYRLSGRRLGASLAAAVAGSDRPGRLAVVSGDQSNGPNYEFALGLLDALGGSLPVVGGASARGLADNLDREIVAGRIVSGTNFAILICGDFRLGQSRETGPHTPETTDQSIASALAQGGGAQPLLAFIFDCRRRRMVMRDEDLLADEHGVFVRRMGGRPFFGMYGPGEIGSTAAGEPFGGVGFSVSTAVLFPPGE